MEAEGVEKGEQEQEADHTENHHNQDGVHFHVQLLLWLKCGGGQEADSCWTSIKTQPSHCG